MNAPLAWLALGAILGVLSCLWLSVPVSVLGGLTATALIGICAKRLTLNTLSFLVLGLCLGQIAVSTQPQAELTPKIAIGQIVSKSGHTALIETENGRLWAQFKDLPPPPNTLVSAQVRKANPRPVLPEAWPSNAQAVLAKAKRVRVGHWTQATTESRSRPLPQWLKHGAVLQALATGQRQGISPSTMDRFRSTATIHLLAISGLHVGMVASAGAFFGWVFSRVLCSGAMAPWSVLGPALGGLGAAIGYGSLVCWPVSTQRAAWMVGFIALCSLANRRVAPWQTLGIAALAVVLFEPSMVISLGFVLSFSAVAALIGWMQPATGWLNHTHPTLLKWAVRSLAATIIASFGTLPISALVFQQLSPVAPLANLVAIPLFAALAVPGALLGVYGPERSSNLFLFVADEAVDLCLSWLALVDVGTVPIAVGYFGAALLFGAVFSIGRPKRAALLVLLALCPARWPSSGLTVQFPAIGQGSAALVAWPDGTHWLIDGGRRGPGLLHWLRRIGVNTIDMVFITHPDIDHFGGLLPVIESLDVGALWVSRRPNIDEQQYRALWLTAHQRNIPTHVFPFSSSDPKKDNDNGLVLSFRHGAHHFLILGDIGTETENRLAKNMPEMSVVSVAHHGSKYSSGAALIAATKTQVAVVQAGKGNTYGHPHPDVVRAWGEHRLLRTDQDGSLHFHSDGTDLMIKRWSLQTLWASVNTPSSVAVDTHADPG
jgi:competence protein ComEC